MSTDLRSLAQDRLPESESTSTSPPAALPLTPPGPPRSFEEEFPYGWRYVQVLRPDGSTAVEQVPLSLEDALHPQEDDQIPSNPIQNQVVDSITNALTTLLRDRENVLILNDILIDWGRHGIKAMSPDIAVLFDARTDVVEGTYRVPEQGGTTEVVIEVTSPSTRSNDVNPKVELYARCGVPRYVIVDVLYDARRDAVDSIQLKDYRAGVQGYELAPPDPSGIVWLERLGLGLVVEGTTVRCLDAQGRPIDTNFANQCQAREQAERLAEEEARARRHEALAREAAEKLAQEEARARRQAEDRIRELEQALRQARGEV